MIILIGNGHDWTSPRGWSVFTTRGNTRSDALADCLAEAAVKNAPELKLRPDWSDGDADFESDFYILRHTLCPAVLTENGFMTSEDDLRYLESRAGKQAVVDLHVEGITEFLQSM